MCVLCYVHACMCYFPGIPVVVIMVHLIPMFTRHGSYQSSFLIKPVLGKVMLFCPRKESWNQVSSSAQLVISPYSRGIWNTNLNILSDFIRGSLKPVFYIHKIHFPWTFLFWKSSNTGKLKEKYNEHLYVL